MYGDIRSCIQQHQPLMIISGLGMSLQGQQVGSALRSVIVIGCTRDAGAPLCWHLDAAEQ